MEGEERVPTKRGKRQRDRGRDKTVIEINPAGRRLSVYLDILLQNFFLER